MALFLLIYNSQREINTSSSKTSTKSVGATQQHSFWRELCCRWIWLNLPKPNDKLKIRYFPFDPLSKLIQREDGILAREFFALNSAATTAKQMKHESSHKTKDSSIHEWIILCYSLPFIFGEPPNPEPHTSLRWLPSEVSSFKTVLSLFASLLLTVALLTW